MVLSPLELEINDTYYVTFANPNSILISIKKGYEKNIYNFILLVSTNFL